MAFSITFEFDTPSLAQMRQIIWFFIPRLRRGRTKFIVGGMWSVLA
jgi:hypothetical protein